MRCLGDDKISKVDYGTLLAPGVEGYVDAFQSVVQHLTGQ